MGFGSKLGWEWSIHAGEWHEISKRVNFAIVPKPLTFELPLDSQEIYRYIHAVALHRSVPTHAFDENIARTFAL